MESYEILDSDFQNDGTDQTGIPIKLITTNKFILFYFLTFGLYSIYWMYKMWKFFKEADGLDVTPVLRAIFGIFFTYQLYEKIKTFAKSNKVEVSYSSSLLFIVFVILTLMTRMPDPVWLISFLTFFCHLQPINAFNSAISNSKMYDGTIKSGLTGVEIALVVVGVLIWILMLIGLFVAEPL